MPDSEPLAEWARHKGLNRRIAHDPLCGFVGADEPWSNDALPRMCVGCLLVELRSDATYDHSALSTLALRALSDIADSAREHLNTVLEWQQRDTS